MQYLLVLYSDESHWPQMSAAEQQQAVKEYTAYTEALQKAEVVRGMGRLQPTRTASTVHVAGGGTQVLDGPYADAKEQLGGFYLIDVPDRESALAWAARCPCAAHGHVEVRPLW